MKRYFLTIIIIAGLIVGCDEENRPISNYSNITKFTYSTPSTLKDSILDMGKIHNDVCEYILTEYEIIADSLWDEDSTLYTRGNWFQYDVSILDYIVDSTWISNSNFSFEVPLDVADSTFAEIGINWGLSTKAVELLGQLDSICDLNNISQNDFNNYCMDMVDSAMTLSDDVEKIAVGPCASVLANSNNFWNDSNIQNKLIGIFEPTSSSNKKSNNNQVLGFRDFSDSEKRRVRNADGKGALVGAVKGGYIASAGGPAAAIAGAVIGSACRCAAYSLKEVLEVESGGDLPWYIDVAIDIFG